jgi:hypothetical protein
MTFGWYTSRHLLIQQQFGICENGLITGSFDSTLASPARAAVSTWNIDSSDVVRKGVWAGQLRQYSRVRNEAALKQPRSPD